MAELPPAPVPRSFGSVIWTPPTADPEPVTAGWCADHYFTDLRLAGDHRHIAEPPSAAELYWRQTTTGGLRFITPPTP